MTTRPEAIRLAEVFETYAVDHQPDGWPAIQQEALNSAAAELRRLHAENEALREALTFYANGEHYNTDPDECFDTVSGEGLNWLFSGIDESTTSIENGSVAKHALESTAHQPAQQPDASATATQPDTDALRALIADDSYALTFQSMGQYRTALLRTLAHKQEQSDAIRKHLGGA